jgi:hypothetical protein
LWGWETQKQWNTIRNKRVGRGMRDSRSGSRQWGTPPAHPQLSKCQKKQVVIGKSQGFWWQSHIPTYPKPQDSKLITCNESYIQPILSHLFHFNVCHGPTFTFEAAFFLVALMRQKLPTYKTRKFWILISNN